MTPDAITAAAVHQAYVRAGYALPREGDVAAFGIRAEPGRVDAFDDVLGLLFMERSKDGDLCWRVLAWPGTTDPGLSVLLRPINASGAAILKPGHYADVWKPGLHKGVHPALVQVRPVSVYRDRDRDGAHDVAGVPVDTGLFGINAHDAYSAQIATKVGGWSAGCQVWQRTSHHRQMLARVAARRAPKAPVSYALFRQSEVLA